MFRIVQKNQLQFFLIPLLIGFVNFAYTQNPNKNYGSFQGNQLKRVYDINQAFGQGRSASLHINSLGISNSEINLLYRSTEKGPYLDNSWFSAKLLTFKDELIEIPEYKFRYDLYRHKLHYSKNTDDEKAMILEDLSIIGFIHDDGRFFKKISYQDQNPFVEIICMGSNTFARFRGAKIITVKNVGPGNDGRVSEKFQIIDEYIFSDDGKHFQSISPRVKSLLKKYPELEPKFKEFKKSYEESRNNHQLDILVAFIQWINNS